MIRATDTRMSLIAIVINNDTNSESSKYIVLKCTVSVKTDRESGLNGVTITRVTDIARNRKPFCFCLKSVNVINACHS